MGGGGLPPGHRSSVTERRGENGRKWRDRESRELVDEGRGKTVSAGQKIKLKNFTKLSKKNITNRVKYTFHKTF